MSHPASDKVWDVIVIGTGMGGGIIGRALAEAGKKVLFLEQGAAPLPNEERALSETPLPEARLVRGLWPTPLHVTLNGKDAAFFAPLGAGVGGSSAFYAATLERPNRHDLESTEDLPHPTGGWPVDYDTMAPWFDRAARMLHLHGTPDPLCPETHMPLDAPPALSKTESSLMHSLAAGGLHPYHAHTGILHQLGKAPQRMDGRSAGVLPALASGHATLISRAKVTRLCANGDSVTGVETQIEGETHFCKAHSYVLAGGALGSPRLLLASSSADWPDGLANRNGLVGRNLMFHLNEMIALWPKTSADNDGPTKAIAYRDHYSAGTRMGTVQSMGIRAKYGEIVHYLNLMLAHTALAKVPGISALTRLPAAIAARLFGHAQIFVGLMEDLPYADNRVLYDPEQPDRLSVSYDFHPELLTRRRAFRKAINRGLKGHRRFFLSLLPDLNFGHSCGTLRFGNDPQTSALNADCRAHDLSNLWVADASFMPTSMGVNPSLTIAANALRVADAMLQENTK